jgi:putative acetyltransferase
VIDIRPEVPGDADAIAAITGAAFALAAHASGTEARIIDALRAAGALTVSLVAEEAGEIVGHVAFSPVSVGSVAAGWYGLGPVSVRPDRQRAGIGTALVEAGLARLRSMGARGCVLVGDPRYYARFGFARDPALRCDGIPDEYVQRIIFTGPPPAGRITFHAGFGLD